eukprot:177741_1
MMASVEGTCFDGEEKDDITGSDFYKWMRSDDVKAKHKFIKKLIDNEIDSIEMLEEIADEPSILKDTDLNSMEKAKLRTILRKLPNKQSIIDKEETEAMMRIQKKLQSMKHSVSLITSTEQKIDEAATMYTKTIKLTFKQIHELLNEREATLINKLNDAVTDKKLKLSTAAKTLNQQSIQSEQQNIECRKLLKKPIDFHQIDVRKTQILKIAKDIDDIKIITKENVMISHNKINLLLDKTEMIKSINSLGDVYGGAIPILISLKDNKDCTVEVSWKLEGTNSVNNNNNKLKVEWMETKSNDIHDQFDEKSQ